VLTDIRALADQFLILFPNINTTLISPLWLLRVREHERERTIRKQPCYGNISYSHAYSSDIKVASHTIYNVYKLSLQVYKQGTAERMDECALDNIVEDICSFLMKHVIPREGKYHDDESQLSMPQFWVLTEIGKLKFTKDGY